VETGARFRRQLVRGGAVLISTRWGTQIFVWAATLLVARFIAPDDYAILALGVLLVDLAEMFVDAGMTRALIHKQQIEPRDVDEVFTLTLLFGLGLYALFFAGADVAQGWFERAGFATFLRVLSLHLLLMPFMAVPLALLDRKLDLGKQSVIHAIASAFQTGLVLLLAYLGLGYWALAVGSLARRLLEIVAYIIVSGWRPRLVLLSGRAGALFQLGIHNSLAGFLWYLYSNIDYAFVDRFDKDMLGYYALAFQLISLPANLLSGNIAKVAYPALCRLQSDPVRLRDWFLRLVALLGFLAFPLMTGMALVAPDGIPIVLGENWAAAVLPFQLLCLAGLFRVVSALFPVLNNALGRADLNLKMTVARVVILPAAFYGAGMVYGMIGVCLVWMLLYPAIVLATISLTRHVTLVSLSDVVRVQARVMASTVLMAAAVLGVQLWLRDTNPVPRLVIAIAIGIATYAAATLLLCRNTIVADLRNLLRDWSGQTAS
jgi:teichuronic acid exporter